jgi:hypothetical protein
MPPPLCPACSAALAPDASQCACCGVALGEDNRCPRCMATAPVYERTGRHVCSACGETRPRQAHTLVTTEAELLQAFEAPPARAPLLAISTALLCASALALLGRVLPDAAWLTWLLAVVAALVFGVVGRNARHRRRVARARRRYEIEQRIIGLAFCNDGLLSANLVSETLRISVMEAQELLGELVATARARAEMSVDGGPTIYHFGEARRTRGLRRSQAP